MKKEINFTLEDVPGELTLEYGPFKQRVYQNGRLIPRKRGKYFVTTAAGDTEEMKIAYGLDFVHVVWFRGQKIPLEERLTTTEYVLGGLPVLLVFLGGLLGVFVGFMGALWIYDYFRTEKRMPQQMAMAVGVSLLCFLLYFAIAIPFNLLIMSFK